MGLNNWLRNKIAAMSIAFSNVEKNIISQNKDTYIEDSHHVQRYQQGTLADALLRGEQTEEVLNLRWRTYKVLDAVKKKKLVVDHVDNDNNTWYKAVNHNGEIINAKIDNFDDYPVDMVIYNDESTVSILDAINDYIETYEKPIDNIDASGNTISKSYGEIKSNEYFALNKGERQILVGREIYPKFFIENFTKKVNIRIIDEQTRLIEFCVSKYPDEYNKTSKLLINEVKKLIERGPDFINFIQIKELDVVTSNTLNKPDFLHFKYDIKKFDKVVEFEGYYVIKFIAEVIINGDNLIEKYVIPELEEKYKNRDKK